MTKGEQEIEAGASGTVSSTARSGPPTTSAPKSASSRHNPTRSEKSRRTYGSHRDPREGHLRKGGADRRITLNWPEKANAQDQKLADEVDAALLDADRDYDIKVLILKANGKGFCSGHAIGNNAVDYPSFVEGARARDTRGRARRICSSSRP